MSRIDFIKELENLLSDIPIEEREEALQYYNDYFEDAGEDHEAEIINQLVSPQRIATIIKADLEANGTDCENRGYFTEKGYQDTIYTEEKFELVNAKSQENEENKENKDSAKKDYWRDYNNNEAKNNTHQQRSNKNVNIGLIVLLAVFAIPIGIPLFFSVFGVIISLVATVLALIFGLGLAGICMIIAGILLFIAGVINPFLGITLFGVGLIVLGIGMLFVIISGFLCKTVLPAMVKGFVYICRLPFRNRSVTA